MNDVSKVMKSVLLAVGVAFLVVSPAAADDRPTENTKTVSLHALLALPVEPSDVWLQQSMSRTKAESLHAGDGRSRQVETFRMGQVTVEATFVDCEGRPIPVPSAFLSSPR